MGFDVTLVDLRHRHHWRKDDDGGGDLACYLWVLTFTCRNICLTHFDGMVQIDYERTGFSNFLFYFVQYLTFSSQ